MTDATDTTSDTDATPVAYMVGDTLTATVRIAAPPEVVFPYFTDAELMVAWIGEHADLDARPGGTFRLRFDSSNAVRGTYLVIEPPHRVMFTWGRPGDPELPEGSTTVEVLLTSDGEDTIVELFHRDLPPVQRERHLEGWGLFVGGMAAVVAGRSA